MTENEFDNLDEDTKYLLTLFHVLTDEEKDDILLLVQYLLGEIEEPPMFYKEYLQQKQLSE